MGSGYTGKILTVDLTRGEIQRHTLPDTIYRRWLSGMGLAAGYLYGRIPAGADPLGPENILGFVCGILTGTGSLFTGRWMVVGKSPLTGGWGDANCGGNFAPAIKQCGLDAIFFSGTSPRPVYLLADGQNAELRDAGAIWGRDSIATESWLAREHGGRRAPRIACIGPAGERRSLMAGVVNDGGRLAARSGLGAVMGAKRLKAVVLTGSRRIAVQDRETMRALSQGVNAVVRGLPPFVPGNVAASMGRLIRALPAQMETDGRLYQMILQKWGTVGMNQMSIEMGDSPIQNWKGTHEDFGPSKSAAIDPDVFTRPVVSKYFCYSCPLGCGALVAGESDGLLHHRPEYETVLALGALCLNSDAASILRMNERLNRAGMDSISAGATLAFAMECYENGLLTRSDTDGLELTWGNSTAMEALLERMIRREGIGDLLADGTRLAAERIGRDSARFAMHAGGQELPMHDGRFDPGFALHYSVEPTPGRHTIGSLLYYEMFQLWRKDDRLPDPSFLYLKSRKYEDDRQKAHMAAACSRFVNVLNAAGACLFGAFLGVHRLPVFEWLNAATGWNRSAQDYLECGSRIQTARQAFNLRHGIDPRRNRAADRALGRPPQTRGANAGRQVPIEGLMQHYWQAFGWDPETGRPDPATLQQLDL
jgi:aldehyde:ferredoxin oxidoreductase